MKKLIISMLMIASCFGVANAQLLVDENGKVGVVYDGAGPLSSELSIGTSGNSNATVSVMSAKGMGMYINHYPMSSSSNNYGIYNINYSVANVTNYGIYTDLSGSSSNGTKNIGVYARVSGTSSSGSNYGLYGYLSSTGHGTGVFGSTAKYLGMTFPNLTGNYAGFFYGDACITGALTVGYVNQTSDYRLKENIRSLTDSDGCLEKVIGMNVVEYNLKQREFELNITEQDKADEAAREAEMIARGIDPQEITKRKQKTENRALWYEEDSPIIRNKHY
ncbi:MAG: tail fiber domain-containing protein, partial [Bacteroidaceae bacterium]|nr:tail fiber domain-containing protein [Bacteroidaceae bacterium]